jgi:FKBP-type peptidyl-prolyl cis-trans isomerase FkpA
MCERPPCGSTSCRYHRPPNPPNPPKEPAVKTMPIALALLACTAFAQGQTDAAKQEPGAVTTQTGLIFNQQKEGSGKSPGPTDTVTVHYRGTLPDGREFDSSYKRGQPATFALNRVIPCWTEGLQRMKPGGKAKLVCPPSIAYGERGAGGVIPPNATLVFEVELLGVGAR